MKYYILFLPVLLILSCKTGSKDAVDDQANRMYAALENSRTEEAMGIIGEIYVANGVEEYKDKLKWEYKDPTEVYNYFDQRIPGIVLGRMPKQDEVKAYWDNWCKVLTNNGWIADSFFRDEKEMLLMANYNIVVLIAHELGHYFAYRYEIGGFSDELVNCRELFADKFAVALTNELVKKDKRFKDIQQRYLELVNSMNLTIPVKNRYTDLSGTLLIQNCDSIVVKQPRFDDTETMQPYASAFFERHRLLITGNAQLQPLRMLVDSVLLKRYYGRIKQYPYLTQKMDTVVKLRWKGIYQPLDLVDFMWNFREYHQDKVPIPELDTLTLVSIDKYANVHEVLVENVSKGEGYQSLFYYKFNNRQAELLPGGPIAANQLMIRPAYLWTSGNENLTVVYRFADKKRKYRCLNYQKSNGSWQVKEIFIPGENPLSRENEWSYGHGCVGENGKFYLLYSTRLTEHSENSNTLYELGSDMTVKSYKAIGPLPMDEGFVSIAVAADERIYIASGISYYISTFKDGKWNTFSGGPLKGDLVDPDPSKSQYFEMSAMAAGNPNKLIILANWKGSNKYFTEANVVEVSF